MILTNCAACAAPLAHDAPRCVRCQTRYCSATCLNKYAARNRPCRDEKCAEIDRGGGAEQYHAKKKYAEALAVAVEACAENTKGQTCYICTQALHWKTKEGLVRGCACRGTAGFAHVSCLVLQAQAASDLCGPGWKRKTPDWERWHTCGLCEQRYHGVVACALGWGRWKSYVGRPEFDRSRWKAMNLLGNGLTAAKRHAEALSVRKAELSMYRRVALDPREFSGAPAHNILCVQGNLATTYHKMGRFDEALRIKQDVYAGRLKLNGNQHEETLIAANNYANSLVALQRFEEAKTLLNETIPVARRVLGESYELTLRMWWIYAEALYKDPGATLDDLREAVETLEDTEGIARRALGAHPVVRGIETALREARAALHGRETRPLKFGIRAQSPPPKTKKT